MRALFAIGLVAALTAGVMAQAPQGAPPALTPIPGAASAEPPVLPPLAAGTP